MGSKFFLTLAGILAVIAVLFLALLIFQQQGLLGVSVLPRRDSSSLEELRSYQAMRTCEAERNECIISCASDAACIGNCQNEQRLSDCVANFNPAN